MNDDVKHFKITVTPLKRMCCSAPDYRPQERGPSPFFMHFKCAACGMAFSIPAERIVMVTHVAVP